MPQYKITWKYQTQFVFEANLEYVGATIRQAERGDIESRTTVCGDVHQQWKQRQRGGVDTTIPCQWDDLLIKELPPMPKQELLF